MSDDNVISLPFPKIAQTQIRPLSFDDATALMAAALSRMQKPMGCLMIFWDEQGVMSVSDNRGQLYTPEQLQWMVYGMAHLKGRGVINPVGQSGDVPPVGA